MRTSKILSLLFVLALLVVAVVPAAAQDGGGEATPEPKKMFVFGIRPADATKGYFTFTLNPGESVNDTLQLINSSDEGTMSLNVIKVAGQTGLTGGVSFDDRTGGPADWIDFPGEGDYTVEAGKGVELPFTVTVPEGTPPGEYAAGFIAMQNEEEAVATEEVKVEGNQSGMTVKIVPKVAIAVMITVPTPDNCEVNVTGVTNELEPVYGRVKATIHMEHVGNLHFKGSGHYELRPVNADGSLGESVFTRDFQVGYFIPGDKMNYPLYTDSIPDAGEYQTVLAFEPEEGTTCKFNIPSDLPTRFEDKTVNETKAQATQSANPVVVQQNNTPLIIAVVAFGGVIVVLLIVLIFVLLRKKDKKEEKNGEGRQA